MWHVAVWPDTVTCLSGVTVCLSIPVAVPVSNSASPEKEETAVSKAGLSRSAVGQEKSLQSLQHDILLGCRF